MTSTQWRAMRSRWVTVAELLELGLMSGLFSQGQPDDSWICWKAGQSLESSAWRRMHVDGQGLQLRWDS